jgi:cytoskeleton protein RodZ
MLQPGSNDTAQPVEAESAQRSANRAPLQLDPNWSAGRKLAEARAQRGWGLDEVAERIRVRREFLAALEDMNIKLLPGRAYALAFLRSYARELGIDERAIIQQFQEESALTREDVTKQIRTPSSKPHKDRPWVWAAAVAVLLSGLVGFRAFQLANQPSQSAEVAAPAQQRAAPEHASFEADAEPRVVEIRAIADGRLEARGPDGTVFFFRTLRAGEVYRPDPSPGWTLHARDGGAFELFVNGAPAGLLGTPGMPVLGRAIDEIQPLAQAQLSPPRS